VSLVAQRRDVLSNAQCTAPSRHVATSLKSLMKGVQTGEEVDEDELHDAVCFSLLQRHP